MRHRFRGLLLTAACAALAAPAAAETLGDAIALAYQTNPTLQAQRANLRALDESYVQARAGYRPQIGADVGVSYTHTDDTDSRRSSASISASQPIYTGGRTTFTVRAAEADILAGREQLRSVEQSVLQAVIQAYVNVRRDQQTLAIRTENVQVLQRQLDEANARFDVGEITRTDVAQAQARLAGAQTLLSSAQAQLAISRSSYAAVVGQSPGELAPEPPLTALPASVEEAFDLAQANNPAIVAAEFAERASRARVALAKSDTRPSVSAQATVGASGGSNAFGRGGFFGDYTNQASVSIGASVPIFTGGLTSSRIRAQQERNNADAIAIEQSRRDVLQQVSQAWNTLLASRANIASSEQQVRANTIAFEGVTQEAQVGLRTTLDTLNAQQELRDSELNLVLARRDEYVAGAAVLASMGVLVAPTLAPNIDAYDPRRNFNAIKYSFAVPYEGGIAVVDKVAAPVEQSRPGERALPTLDAPAGSTAALKGAPLAPVAAATPAKGPSVAVRVAQAPVAAAKAVKSGAAKAVQAVTPKSKPAPAKAGATAAAKPAAAPVKTSQAGQKPAKAAVDGAAARPRGA